MPAHQKQYKSAEFIQSSDIDVDDSASSGAAHDKESIDSPTLIGGTSFLQDSIDRELDEEVLEPPADVPTQAVATKTASKAKKGAYIDCFLFYSFVSLDQ